MKKKKKERGEKIKIKSEKSSCRSSSRRRRRRDKGEVENKKSEKVSINHTALLLNDLVPPLPLPFQKALSSIQGV